MVAPTGMVVIVRFTVAVIHCKAPSGRGLPTIVGWGRMRCDIAPLISLSRGLLPSPVGDTSLSEGGFGGYRSFHRSRGITQFTVGADSISARLFWLNRSSRRQQATALPSTVVIVHSTATV